MKLRQRCLTSRYCRTEIICENTRKEAKNDHTKKAEGEKEIVLLKDKDIDRLEMFLL